MEQGKLILFPVPIGATDISQSLPAYNLTLLNTCHTFIVEEVRTARRFLRAAGYEHPIDETHFFVLNEHTAIDEDLNAYLADIYCGRNVGLLSEAGLPCIADPGRRITLLAQQKGIEIHPLVGPSSLLMALMASGLNGQNFAFVGYLPAERQQRLQAIRQIESQARRNNQAQIFIEAPYRNNQMLEAMSETCHADTLITIATDLTMPTQTIRTRSAQEWRHARKEIDLHHRNTVFIVGTVM